MKTELFIIAVLAMVVSSFLNVNSPAQSNDHLAVTKLRIENAAGTYAKSQQVKTVATNKELAKPNEG